MTSRLLSAQMPVDGRFITEVSTMMLSKLPGASFCIMSSSDEMRPLGSWLAMSMTTVTTCLMPRSLITSTSAGTSGLHTVTELYSSLSCRPNSAT